MQQRLGAEPEQEAREADRLLARGAGLTGRRRLRLRCRGSLLVLGAGRGVLLSRLPVIREAAPIGYPEPARRIVFIDHDHFPGDASEATIEMPAACPNAPPNRVYWRPFSRTHRIHPAPLASTRSGVSSCGTERSSTVSGDCCCSLGEPRYARTLDPGSELVKDSRRLSASSTRAAVTVGALAHSCPVAPSPIAMTALPMGTQRAGSVDVKSATPGQPTAAARWLTPLSLPAYASTEPRSAATSSRCQSRAGTAHPRGSSMASAGPRSSITLPA